MIFADNEEIYEKIKNSIVTSIKNILIKEVLDYDYVKQHGDVLANANLGVYMMAKNVERGISLRLGAEAIVYVINNDTWSMTDCQQMIGRGCRSMGRAHGIIFGALSDQYDRSNGVEMLIARLNQADKMTITTGSVYILAGLVHIWKSLTLQ